MHEASYESMGKFNDKYLKGKSGLRVLDVGGSVVNGSYSEIFNKHIYKTLDWDNSDYIVKGYEWPEELTNSFDVVISGQTLEHDKFFWKTLTNMSKVLKSGGYLCIIVPSTGHIHKYPIDCYRFYEDCMAGWAEWMEIDLVESVLDPTVKIWKDLKGVFIKK